MKHEFKVGDSIVRTDVVGTWRGVLYQDRGHGCFMTVGWWDDAVRSKKATYRQLGTSDFTPDTSDKKVTKSMI